MIFCRTAAVFAILALIAVEAAAQTSIKLAGRRGTEVELAYGKRSVVFDLGAALTGTNGSLPGNPPHRYTVLFTAEKNGMIYVVADVHGVSPVTALMAACTGDRPRSLLWIEADKTLKNRRVRSEVYASCVYNYRGSKVSKDRDAITVLMSGGRKVELRYDNAAPEQGLVLRTVD